MRLRSWRTEYPRRIWSMFLMNVTAARERGEVLMEQKIIVETSGNFDWNKNRYSRAASPKLFIR